MNISPEHSVLEIRPAEDPDPSRVYMRMTDRERQDLQMEFGWTARAEMGLCLAQSDKAFTVLKEGAPVLMFGVWRTERDESCGKLWFIGSKAAYTENVREFALKSYAFLPELAVGYRHLGSVVSTKDKQLLRWLRFLGFSKTAEYPEDHQAEYLIAL